MISREDIETWTRLFQHQYGLVVGAARRYAPAPDLVDDIVQQVYLEFIKGASKGNWDLEKNVGPLLYRITKRQARLFWRDRLKRKNSAIDGILEQLMASTGTLRESESDAYEINAARLETLDQCLDKLPAKSRMIIEQHYFGGMKIKEIGERMNVKNMSSLYHIMIRIRIKLRQCIERYLKDN